MVDDYTAKKNYKELNHQLAESFINAKDYKTHSSSFFQSKKKLKPLDKRLAEARINGINAMSMHQSVNSSSVINVIGDDMRL